MTTHGTVGLRYHKTNHMTAKDLRALRKAKGWTQEILAEALQVHISTLRKWEQGVHAISPPMQRFLRIVLGTATMDSERGA